MTNNRTILITGVTGNQGGAVAQTLQGSEFHLRGLTRKPDRAFRCGQLYGHCKRMKGNALMPQVERCCFRKRPPDDSLFLIIHVGQQDSLTETIEAALTSGGEFGNGKN
jgi:nucleoside-diphosphate-sugar epimerase